jgi:hypothetical protein
MKFAITFVVLLSLNGISLYCQQIPVIHSTSKEVSIRDGNHFKKNYWYLMPEKRPDTYYVEIPLKSHRVTFYTDIDSISFDAEYGGKYDFVILLNKTDTCFTRIIAAQKNLLKSSNADGRPAKMTDTIPFTIGNNNKIFIRGTINRSDTVKFQFDLGSSISGIKTSTSQKISMKFNSPNKDGDVISSYNLLNIGGLQWDSIPIQIYDRNMTYREDGILGNGLFMDKILEINYDKLVIVVHDIMPPNLESYVKQDMIFEGVVPQLEATIIASNGKRSKFWFIFDTGDSGNAYISEDMAKTFDLYGNVDHIISIPGRQIVELPGLEIGGLHFKNVPGLLSSRGKGAAEFSVLGNELLKRFNVIVDNRNGNIYLKKNSLVGLPFDNPRILIYGILAGGLFLLVVLIFGFRFLYRRSKAKRTRI